MRAGKSPAHLMERLLSKVDVSDPRVLLGPAVGEDAAVLDYGDRVLVAKSDPVTFATRRAGWHAVQVNANDVACAGAVPRWFLATLLVPENTSEVDAEVVFSQVLEACASLGVTLIGGHSEVTIGITHSIVVGCMLGEVPKGKLVTTGGAMPGDAILLTRGVALEGTALLAWDADESLARAGVSPATIDRAREMLTTPGISVVKEALAACSTVGVNSLHDPTEGGLATALRELATAAGVGLVLEEWRCRSSRNAPRYARRWVWTPWACWRRGPCSSRCLQRRRPGLSRFWSQKGWTPARSVGSQARTMGWLC